MRSIVLNLLLFGMTFGLGYSAALLFTSETTTASDRGCTGPAAPNSDKGSAIAIDRAPAFPDSILYDVSPSVPKNEESVRIISRPAAAYTESALQNKAEGAVMLRITFLASGKIGDVRVLRGLPYGLNEKAIEAARQIEFRPRTVEGRPVDTAMTFQYGFNIY